MNRSAARLCSTPADARAATVREPSVRAPGAAVFSLAPLLNVVFMASVASMAAGGLVACSSVPDRNAALEMARSQHATLPGTPEAERLAPQEVDSASTALRRAEAAQAEGESRDTVDHLAYLAGQKAVLAQAAAGSRAAQAVTAGAAAERDRLRLEVRTVEADQAQRALRAAEQATQQATQDAARVASQQAARDANARATARSSAEIEQARLAASTDQVNRLSAPLRELQSLNARQTDRGIVVTLGDMLFSTGHAELQPGGARHVNQLAEFLLSHPAQRVTIEGHTDSVGSHSSNMALSERRAQSVRTLLMGKGVEADRLRATGFGPDSPVASNATQAGRQLNRRVEVVFVPLEPGTASR